MAFYNEVKVGDTFKPSANLHNDTIRLINRMNGISEATTKGKGNGATVLKVYNPTDVDFAPGTPVNFDNDQAIVEEHVPIKSYSDEQAPWGVLKDGLQAGCFGSCIVSGPVTISLSGEGKYAVPSNKGFNFIDVIPEEGNFAQVLYFKDKIGVICLGVTREKKEKFFYNKPILVELDTDWYGYTNNFPVTYVDSEGNTRTTILCCTTLALGEGVVLPQGTKVIGYPIETETLELEILKK